MNEIYTPSFHDNLDAKTRHAADLVSSTLMGWFPATRSVIDVGCGLGTWLAAFRARGVTSTVGIDGEWVDRGKLMVPEDCFFTADLNNPWSVEGRFDLALCLEAAEHIREENSDFLVEFLCAKADVVLFSAAVPRQGGFLHVNEHWPSYWAEKFARCGFRVEDPLRQRIWSDASVPYWYRQNLLLFLGPNVDAKSCVWREEPGASPLDVVHPYLYLERTTPPTMRQALRLLAEALWRSCRKRMGRTAANS